MRNPRMGDLIDNNEQDEFDEFNIQIERFDRFFAGKNPLGGEDRMNSYKEAIRLYQIPFIPIKLKRRTKEEMGEYFELIWGTLPYWQRDLLKHYLRSLEMSVSLKEPTNKHSQAHRIWRKEKQRIARENITPTDEVQSPDDDMPKPLKKSMIDKLKDAFLKKAKDGESPVSNR